MNLSSLSSSLKSLQKRSDMHLLRKLWHVGTGLAGFVVYTSTNISLDTIGRGLVFFAVLVLIVESFRLKNPGLNRLILSVMGPFMRESERNKVSGMPFYALGVGVALTFFYKPVALLAVLFLIFADPISSIVGIKFGRTKILPNKSLEGCVAGFLTCFLLTAAFTGLSVMPFLATWKWMTFCFFAGVIGMLSEMASVYNLDDNFTVPVISSIGLSILNSILIVF